MQLSTLLRRAGWRGAVPAGALPHLVPDVRQRTLDATGSARAADEMVAICGSLNLSQRSAVLEPTRRLARTGKQIDSTSCGSAVLAMLAATGDPTLALWLATGRLIEARRPPELAGAASGTLASLANAPQPARFALVQRALKRRSTARALLGLPWPAALGTPPWGAARTARFPGVRFRHLPVDDTDAEHLSSVLDAVERAVTCGVPVPLYCGGDSARGWATAVPRHVVLAVGATAGGLRVWEPGAGRVVAVGRDSLAAGAGPQRALGGWAHVVWAVLPAA